MYGVRYQILDFLARFSNEYVSLFLLTIDVAQRWQNEKVVRIISLDDLGLQFFNQLKFCFKKKNFVFVTSVVLHKDVIGARDIWIQVLIS